MASAPECVARFIQEAIFATSPALTARRLREKAPHLWPASGKGGGRTSPQVTSHNLTNFVLAQAALQPIDAAGAVEALWGLFLTERETLVQVEPDRPAPTPGAAMVYGRQEPGWPLGWILETLISSAVDPEMREAMQEIAGYEWALTLCVEPAFATISYRYGNELRTDIFGQRLFTDRAQHLVRMPYRTIVICGELLEGGYEIRSAAPARAALPKRPPSATCEEKSPPQVDPIARARVGATHAARGDRHAYVGRQPRTTSSVAAAAP